MIPFLCLLPLLGYVSGSFSFALWVTRALKGIDLREVGSHHATTTNTIRTAGWGAGVVVFALDIAKGFAPTWLAVWSGAPAWLVGLTAAGAVAGHCWPVFSGFRGGMGLATLGGGLLVVSPLGFAVGLGVLVALTLGLRHGARASVLTGASLSPLFWLLGLPIPAVWIGALGGAVIAVRFSIDWRREYRELWLDRECGRVLPPSREQKKR